MHAAVAILFSFENFPIFIDSVMDSDEHLFSILSGLSAAQEDESKFALTWEDVASARSCRSVLLEPGCMLWQKLAQSESSVAAISRGLCALMREPAEDGGDASLTSVALYSTLLQLPGSPVSCA